MARNKIALIGSGQIGGTLAHIIAQRELADVVLLDIKAKIGVSKGKALDIMEGRPIFGGDVNLKGTASYRDIQGSDVIIITAGVPRKPGMSRDDLFEINSSIMTDVAANIKKYAPKAFIIVVANPLDVMVTLCKKITKVPRSRIVGMAGVLDTARFRCFVAMELGVSVEDVTAIVLGGHGDSMVPLPRYCTVAGVPISQFMSRDTIDAIVKRTKGAGGEIVGLLKTGSAYYSPAEAAIQMAEAVLKDKKRVLPAAAYLEGEYGAKGIFMGVPVLLGAKGMEKIIEVELTASEKKLVKASVDHVKKLVKKL